MTKIVKSVLFQVHQVTTYAIPQVEECFF